MSKFFRKITALFSVFTAGIMGVVGFYSLTLPDSFDVSKGGRLMINSLFSISAAPCDTAAVSAQTKAVSNNTLMLFGVVPIKDVAAKEVERPLLYPCGQAFGIKLITDGVMVVDTASVDGVSPAAKCGIKEGDIIISINDEKIRSNDDIAKIISDSCGETCSVELRRDGRSKKVDLTPVFGEGGYKAGLWVRDSSAGIGTLTFFDPETNCFGGLGHPICDADTKEILPLSKGIAGDVKITGYNRSEKGNPGQLLGEFTDSAAIGDITSNCSDGIFGKLNENPSKTEPVELSFKQELHTGEAYILSSIDGGEPKKYTVNIEQINLDDNAEHDMIIKVTDKELIQKTGGIVQGMSGSPIIQDGRLAGAVTHVFIDDPTMGYGIFAQEMYKKAQQQAYNNKNLGNAS